MQDLLVKAYMEIHILVGYWDDIDKEVSTSFIGEHIQRCHIAKLEIFSLNACFRELSLKNDQSDDPLALCMEI